VEVAVGVAVAVGVGVAVGVAVGVTVFEGMTVAVGVGEGLAVAVGVGEGLAVAVGVAEEVVAVQPKVPESHAGSVPNNLRVPSALPSLGNEPLTAYSPGRPGPKALATMSRGKGYEYASWKSHTSPGTLDAVKTCTFDRSPETVNPTVPQGGAAQPVISPL
jgi:hypothetical protein